MPNKILVLMTKAKTLGLIDGQDHPSGFWAEEFVVPYERFIDAGYDVTVATIGGEPPTADAGSLTPYVVGLTRPKGSPDKDEENVAHYSEVIDSLEALRKPEDVSTITRADLDDYAGVYISGGHGAIEDFPHDPAMTRLVRWVLESGLPVGVVCHGQSALLPLRDSRGRWPLEGYRMTAFSHDEEMVTDMAGKLPFVLQLELERLGAEYEKADVIWDSHVVVHGNLISGQNPYSSTALAETFLSVLNERRA